jgi:hypothetical protein
MAKAAYKSKFDGARPVFERHVCVDGEYRATWKFLQDENADHIVREWVERSIGPISEHTASVADPKSAHPMSDSNPGMGIPR